MAISTTARGYRWPDGNERVRDGDNAIHNLADDADARTANGGLTTATTDASGYLNITHGLGRVPVGWAAMVVGSTTYVCTVGAAAPNSTTCQIQVWNRTNGVGLASTSISVRWVAF